MCRWHELVQASVRVACVGVCCRDEDFDMESELQEAEKEKEQTTSDRSSGLVAMATFPLVEVHTSVVLTTGRHNK